MRVENVFKLCLTNNCKSLCLFHWSTYTETMEHLHDLQIPYRIIKFILMMLCKHLLIQWFCIAYRFDSLSKNLFVNSNHSNSCPDFCPWGIGLKWLTHFTNSNKSSLILVFHSPWTWTKWKRPRLVSKHFGVLKTEV